MFRRGVTFLAVVCVLLGQLSQFALTHTHEGELPPGHDLRPHVHFAQARHEHPHPRPDAGDEDDPSPPHRQNHDAGVTCIAGIDMLPASAAVEFGACEFVTPVVFLTFGVPHASDARAKEVQNHPPPGASCPLFVRHCAILI